MGYSEVKTSLYTSSSTPVLVSPAAGPGASPRVAVDQGFRTFELEPWVTIRANASGPAPWPPVLSVTQDAGGWIDLQRFADAAFWVEVAEVTQPTGGMVQLVIESSPSQDEPFFSPATPAVSVAPVTDPATGRTMPFLVRTARTPTIAPLSRWTRWRLTVTPGSTGPWDVTFRIRGAGGRSSFALPNQLAGCLLWLRADLGVTQRPAPDGTVATWADQSGHGNHAIQTDPTSSPFYNQTGHSINGQQVLVFDPTVDPKFMNLTTSLGSPSALHAFVVHRRPIATESFGLYTGFWTMGTSGSATHMPWSGDQHIYDDGGGTTRYDCGTAVVPLDQAQVYEVQNQSGSWKNLLNGKPQFTSIVNTVGAGAGAPIIGATPVNNVYYRGDMAEVVFYNRILTPNERALLVNYLNGRYGLGAV